MGTNKSINISIKIETVTGEPLHIKSIQVNDQFFFSNLKNQLILTKQKELSKKK